MAAALLVAAPLSGQPSPGAGGPGLPRTLRWGLQRPDLIRYNRVEGLSVAARGQLRPSTPWGRTSLTARASLGTEDRVPNLRVDLTREGLARMLTLSAYHELAALEEDARHLGLANSVTTLLLGRDYGDYYRRAGMSVELRPPTAVERSFRVTAYAERHWAVRAGDPPSLRHLGGDGWRHRPNLRAEEGLDAGGLVEISPWWGSDPRRVEAGVATGFRVGAGDWRYRTATARGTVILPLGGRGRMAAEVAGGRTWGSAPPQRGFLVGGPTTLRGYEPATLSGDSFARVRGEVARLFSFGAVTLFTDGAWAGDAGAFSADLALWSSGVGLALVDDLIRADAAWALSGGRGFRVELYLDGIL